MFCKPETANVSRREAEGNPGSLEFTKHTVSQGDSQYAFHYELKAGLHEKRFGHGTSENGHPSPKFLFAITCLHDNSQECTIFS